MSKPSPIPDSWSTLRSKNDTNQSSENIDLSQIISTYGSQPELLGLILSSKVEEDRRRAEEAKLRRKELDYMMHQQENRVDRSENCLPPIYTDVTPIEPPLPRITHTKSYHPIQPAWSDTKSTNTDTYLKPALSNRSSNNNLDMLLSPSLSEQEIKTNVSSSDNSTSYKSPSPSHHTPNTHRINKRRRREMQAITTIIETKEYPYNDDYLWKNNGNTVHKKTGYKSIYYKCSNSAKGCPVNKTITFKENEEYLIKYRGQHLVECNRINRITDL
ncbi:hypothetical protein BDB01DRAFT_842463 [Pilobolus umbonatus]|nr:hypothetical protein BDB01DRAFT_842463 [Pilobolus umbonatus]